MTQLTDFEAAQAKEYGQYVAAETIFIGGARAFNAGDPVPASHIVSGAVAAEQVTAVEAAPVQNKKG